MHLGFFAGILALRLVSGNAAYNHESIEDIAFAISDPGSDRFRQYLSAEEASQLLKQVPVITYPSNSTSTRRNVQRSSNARQHLHKRSELKSRDDCTLNDGLVTPTCLRQVYGIDYTPAPDRVTFAVFATEAATYQPGDLTTYLQQYRPEAQAATYEVIGDGDSANSSNVEALFETALDTQTLLGTAWPAKGLLYNTGGVFGPNPGQPYKPFVDFLEDLVKNETIPSVVSFSESAPETLFDVEYARTICTLLALVGTRGISLLFSSGDNGPNGDTADGVHKQVFETEFPASCPWVTAIGGTTNIASETAATSSTVPAFDSTFYVASGGGFSNIFDTPSYQAQEVSNYISQHVLASYESIAGFNARGRGVPDLSAFSTQVPTVVNGVSLPLGGTSASTPIWAAVITLLNDYEASYGRPPLGFLNPWLYTLQGDIRALEDITTGGNNKGGCNVLSGCNLTATYGYDVAVGWDPVTGLGSPLFSNLLKALDGTAAFDCS